MYLYKYIRGSKIFHIVNPGIDIPKGEGNTYCKKENGYRSEKKMNKNLICTNEFQYDKAVCKVCWKIAVDLVKKNKK